MLASSLVSLFFSIHTGKYYQFYLPSKCVWDLATPTAASPVQPAHLQFVLQPQPHALPASTLVPNNLCSNPQPVMLLKTKSDHVTPPSLKASHLTQNKSQSLPSQAARNKLPPCLYFSGLTAHKPPSSLLSPPALLLRLGNSVPPDNSMTSYFIFLVFAQMLPHH